MTARVSAEVAKAIKAVQKRYSQAVATRGNVGENFTEDSLYQYSGVQPIVGRTAINNFYQAAFSAFPKSKDSSNDMSILMTTTDGPFCEASTVKDPKMVVDYGTALGKGPAPTGGMMELNQLYTVVYVKENNDWKVKIAAINVVGDQSGKYPDYLREAIADKTYSNKQ